ncbi:MAG: hypothetical protein KAW89_02250 [Armatimonadetes bacterium]|nr:hypothetical protein [Armatimonadota bacterium]
MADELDDLQYPAQETGQDIEEQALHPAKAVPAHKPGWLARLGERISNQVSGISLPEWNLRSFLYGLALLVAFILIWRNWVDIRLDVLIWRFDVPKSIVIILAILLGAGLVRAWEAYHSRRAARAEQSEEA